MFTLENIFQFFSIVGIFVLGWYTWETYRLRKNSEKQLKASVRPVLHILDNVIYCNNYLLYCYYNVAFNVKIFIQTEN